MSKNPVIFDPKTKDSIIMNMELLRDCKYFLEISGHSGIGKDKKPLNFWFFDIDPSNTEDDNTLWDIEHLGKIRLPIVASVAVCYLRNRIKIESDLGTRLISDLKSEVDKWDLFTPIREDK